jgi:hypothetical protein
MKIIHSILTVVVLGCICYGCHKKDTFPTIEVCYQNYSIESVVGPSWESVINGEHPEYLIKTTISKKDVCDSIISQIKMLSPMKKEAVPEDCKTNMQCIIRYPSSHKADTLLIGYWCISLNGVVMKDNGVLVQMIKKHSGFYNPHFKSL